MNVWDLIQSKWAELSLITRILLSLATTAFVVELVLKRIAPKSQAYRQWSKGLKAVGAFWTAIILGIVYFVPVMLTNLVCRVMQRDLLERRVRQQSTSWHPHQQNPLGRDRAAGMQF